MSMIPLEVLGELSGHFNTAPGGGLDSLSFVELFLTLLPIQNFDGVDQHKASVLRLLAEISYAIGVLRLFSDIDINGDQSLEWDELTQYLVDTVLAQSNKEAATESPVTEDKVSKDRQKLLETELLSIAPKLYRVSLTADKPVCQKKIIQAVMLPQTIAVLEDLSDQLKLYTPDLGVKADFHVGFRVFSVAVDTVSGLLCCLSSEPSLLFYDLAREDFPRVYRQRLACLHSQLFFMPKHKTWAVVQSNSKAIFGELIGQPPLETRRWETLATVQTHSDRLTGLVEASNSDWFATSSLDGSIKVWSLIDNKLLSKISEDQEGFESKHSTNHELGAFGIAGIDHCKKDPSYLLSWGFHTNVLIWQPILSPSHPLTRKYSGHVGILTSAIFLETSRAVASLDNRGTMKIWDYLTGETLQSLPLMEGNMTRHISSLVILGLDNHPWPDSVILGGKNILRLENPSLSTQLSIVKESPPLSLVYIIHFEGVLVLTPSHLKAIRAENGEVLFSNALVKRATNMIEGARGRKVYVAYEDGSIELLNAQNAKLLKPVTSLREEELQAIKHAQLTLTKMAPTPEDDRIPGAIMYLHDEQILVVGLHSVVYLFDDSDSMESTLLKFFVGGHEDATITALAYSRTNGILASGSANGIVSLWMLYLNVHLTAFSIEEPVKHLCCVDPFSAIVVVSNSGKISFWGITVPGLNVKITPGSAPVPFCLGIFDIATNITCCTQFLELPLSYEFPISSKTGHFQTSGDDLGERYTTIREDMASNKQVKTSLMLLGDDHGCLTCIELVPFLLFMGIKPQAPHPCKSMKESRLMRQEHLAAQKSVTLALGINHNSPSTEVSTVAFNSFKKFSLSRLCQFSTRLHNKRITGIVHPPDTRYFLSVGAEDKLLKAITNSGLEIASRSLVLNSTLGSSWGLDLNIKSKLSAEIRTAYQILLEIKGNLPTSEDKVVDSFLDTLRHIHRGKSDSQVNRAAVRLNNYVTSRQQNQHERMLLEKYNEELKKAESAQHTVPSAFLTQVMQESPTVLSRFRGRESSRGKRFFEVVQDNCESRFIF